MKNKSADMEPVQSKKNKPSKQKLTARFEGTQKFEKKKNTSLRLNKQTLKALKIRAIEQDTSIQKLVESLIKDYLSKTDP